MAIRDRTTRRGAEQEAEEIRAYWRARGKEVEVTVVMVPGSSHRPLMYVTRSNMKNGQPA